MPDATRLEAIEAAAWSDALAAAGTKTRILDGVTILALPSLPNPDMNRAIGLGSIAPATEVLLDATIASFPDGVPYFLQVVPDCNPPELHAWIRARGFTPRRRWVQLYRELGSGASESGAAAGSGSPVAVRRAGQEQSNAFGETMCEGFGLPDSAAAWLAKMVGRPGWRSYLAYVEDKVAGAGLMSVQDGSAYLALGCALKAFRRRGVQAALITRRLADAQAAGASLAVSEAAEDIPEKPNPSLHNLLRLGFREAYKRENYQRD